MAGKTMIPVYECGRCDTTHDSFPEAAACCADVNERVQCSECDAVLYEGDECDCDCGGEAKTQE